MRTWCASAGDGRRSTIQEVSVEAGAPCDQQKIRDIQWPATSVIASVRRGQAVITPTATQRFQAGDVLVVVTDGPATSDYDLLCKR